MKTETHTKMPDLLDAEAPASKLPATRQPRRTAVAAPAQPTTPMDLLRIVTERGASAEEVGKFMDLVERQQAREAKQAFVASIVEFKKEVQTVIKNARAGFVGKNKETGERGRVEYDFATLGHICEAIIANLAERGITHDWQPEQPSEGPDKGLILMTCVLTHVQGHSKSATVKFPADPSGTKNGLQAIGSGMSYGERYSLLAVCGIATKEQVDDDGRCAMPQDQQSEQKPARHPLGDKGFSAALAAIKSGQFTLAQVEASNALTAKQRELALKAEQERAQ